MQGLDPLDHRRKLAFQRRVQQVGFVLPGNRPVRRNRDRFHVVDFPEFFHFGPGRPSHPRQFTVHPEQVLVGDVGHRFVFFLDFHMFLGFDGLVQPIGEAPAFHYPPGKGVHDQDFTVGNHVVLIL